VGISILKADFKPFLMVFMLKKILKADWLNNLKIRKKAQFILIY
jgi:hypothetical protein